MKSTQIKTEADAKSNWPCPIARIKTHAGPNCEGTNCPLWRWMPVMMKQEHIEANKACVKRGMTTKEAAAYVADNPSEFGLPEGPFEGFCGLGGEVLA